MGTLSEVADLIDHNYSVQDALRRVNEVTDWYFAVAAGAVPGFKSVNKFGTNTNIADGTEEIVWSGSGTYTWSTTDDITDLVSDNVADNGLTIEVRGLDANWEEVVQEVTLGTPATTSVNLTTPLIRAFRMRVNDSSTNTGTVQVGVGNATGSFAIGNLRAQIDPTRGQTLMAIYTIPANKNGYVSKYYGSMVGDPGPPARAPDYTIYRAYTIDRANNYAAQLKHVVGGSMVGTSLLEHEFIPPVKLTEKTDIYISAQPEGDVGSVSAGFDLILQDT